MSKILFLLKYNSIEIYVDNFGGPSILNFTSGVLNHLEVKDPDSFAGLLTEYLSNLGIKNGRALILLSDEVLFNKNLKDSNLADFSETVPLESDKLVTRSLQKDDNTFVFGTNKDLYEIVVMTLQKIGISVSAVLPISIFGVGKNGSVLTKEEIINVWQNEKAFARLNFLKKKTGKNYEWIYFLCVFGLLAALLASYYYLQKIIKGY